MRQTKGKRIRRGKDSKREEIEDRKGRGEWKLKRKEKWKR